MLQHLHEDQKADAIMAALKKVLASGHVTPDLGGTATTTSFADAICRTSVSSRSSSSMRSRHHRRSRPRQGRRGAFSRGQPWPDERRGARTQVMAYLDELQTTQRYELYRALEYPLYPILRKIERVGEHQQLAVDAVKKGRVVYASNHRSHIDYLVEPLVLDDAGIRPPIIAAGINLFGGPLGLIHKHVTGALPIRRNTKDPGLPDHAQGLRQRAAAQARSVLLSGRRPQLQRRAQADEGGPAQRLPRRQRARA